MRAGSRRAASALIAMPLAVAAAGLWACAAIATPTRVETRIVGSRETLFEGPLLTEGHDIKASSDTEERPCDGVNPNDPENVMPGATPTAAAVDAMTIIGETFNGVWYPGRDDYLITRFGPEAEAEGESWWVFVNGTLLDVGGCQYELNEGAEALWRFGSLASRPMLTLFAAGTGTDVGLPSLTASAELNVPFTVEVLSYQPRAGKPPALPERVGSSPAGGVTVAPVQTAPNGFETPLVEAPGAVKTDGEGKVSLTFTTSGWHRIMAAAAGDVRSNRLDVCVPAPGEAGCGAPPAEDEPRTVEAGGGTEEPGMEEEAGGTEKEPVGAEEPVCAESATQRAGPQGSTCTGSEGGSPDESSSSNETPPAGDTPSGSAGPPGSAVPVAKAQTSASHTVARAITLDGLTLVPLAAGSPALHYRGHWRRRAERAALEGAVMVGGAGATVTATLAPGRPAFVLRDLRHTARVEVRAASGRTKFTLPGSRSTASRLLLAARRRHTGPVTLRVIAGTVGIDGVAVTT
ncbi:MAG TPA: hypothetical protein VMB51_13620 [Solirubrobacteraceae bacterium]|nr:hypothetical protein [Solirubrobacteraceae bacterium]